jgi:glucan phosphoethanolaminetransferase (alkaline phosphatase superfamily)
LLPTILFVVALWSMVTLYTYWYPFHAAMAKSLLDAHPWEILAIASVYLLPGICLALQKYPIILLPPRRYRPVVLPISMIHSMGGLAIVVALLFVALYVYVRREIARDQSEGTFL